MPLIVISGDAGVGKDTLAEAILAENPRYKIKKFAEPLKREVADMLGLTYEVVDSREGKSMFIEVHGKTVGELLQEHGQGNREANPNYWVDKLLPDYDPKTDFWVISDGRYPNEIDRIIELGGIHVRLIRNDYDYEAALGGRDKNHSSERALDDYDGFAYVFEDVPIEYIPTVAKKVIFLADRNHGSTKYV